MSDEEIKKELSKLKESMNRIEQIIIEGFGQLRENDLAHIQFMLKDTITGLKEMSQRSSYFEQIIRSPEVIIVEEMSREEAKRKVLNYIRKHKASDIVELHKHVRCDIRLLVEIIDELQREGKIEEI
jgi:hypothetical protein